MDMFAALADPTRRNIVELLSDSGQMSASDIYTHFKISHPAISQHLKILREARLVDMEKRAQQRIYGINMQTMSAVESWIQRTTKKWNSRLNKLEEFLINDKGGEE